MAANDARSEVIPRPAMRWTWGDPRSTGPAIIFHRAEYCSQSLVHRSRASGSGLLKGSPLPRSILEYDLRVTCAAPRHASHRYEWFARRTGHRSRKESRAAADFSTLTRDIREGYTATTGEKERRSNRYEGRKEGRKVTIRVNLRNESPWRGWSDSRML